MKILYAIHDFLPRHCAGSELYAYHLCQEMRQRHDVCVLAAEYEPSHQQGKVVHRQYREIPIVELTNNWSFSGFEESYRSAAMNRILDDQLASIKPDILHLHRLLNLSMDLPALAKRRGIAVVATLHDHSLVCASGGQRVHLDEAYVCSSIDTSRCSRCFMQSPFYQQMAFASALGAFPIPKPAMNLLRIFRRQLSPLVPLLRKLNPARNAVTGVTPLQLQQRLDYLQEVIDAVDVFVAPSQALADEYFRLGMPESKLRVSDYGFPPLAPRTPAKQPANLDAKESQKLRIGFVGTLVWHKGIHVLLEAVRRLPPGRFEVLLFGSTATFPDYTKSLSQLAGGLPVIFKGGFDSDQTAEVYEQLDVLVVPSLWPENSPLVIHEAYQMGIPVVGARMGGIVDLVEHGESGLTYPPFSSEDLAAALLELIDHPERLTQFRDALPPVKSIADDAKEWEAVYEELLPQRRAP